jgi:hypothetical protein
MSGLKSADLIERNICMALEFIGNIPIGLTVAP